MADSTRQGRVQNENAQMQQALEFRRLVSQGQFEPAFEIGERLMELPMLPETQEVLSLPIGHGSSVFSPFRMHQLLQQLEADPGVTSPVWRLHLRFTLLERLEWKEEALLLSAELVRVPERYGWMRYGRGLLLKKLHSAFDEAMADFEAILAATPDFWKAGACIAECLLCLGRDAEAFEVMDRYVTQQSMNVLAHDAQMAFTWRGEMHLWMGRYAEAIEDIDRAMSLADQRARGTNLELGWRGAAYLQLGQIERAIVDLDQAVKHERHDSESLVWRGEAHERLEHWNKAMTDFDRAVSMGGAMLWALVGRALMRARIGNYQGLWADYDAIPMRVRNLFEWKLGAVVGRDPARAVAVMEAMRVAARGMRRPELYLCSLWMKR